MSRLKQTLFGHTKVKGPEEEVKIFDSLFTKGLTLATPFIIHNYIIHPQLFGDHTLTFPRGKKRPVCNLLYYSGHLFT